MAKKKIRGEGHFKTTVNVLHQVCKPSVVMLRVTTLKRLPVWRKVDKNVLKNQERKR